MTNQRYSLDVVNKAHWDVDGNEQCLGCLDCGDRRLCGGISPNHDLQLYSCFDLCKNCKPGNCKWVCPGDPSHFVARLQEINGLSMDSVPVAPRSQRPPALPDVVPVIYHGDRRVEALQTQAVAIPLRKLFSHRSGLVKFGSRQELASTFKFAHDALIIADGVAKDAPLEAYWSKGRRAGVARELVRLGVDIITTPNFSVFSDLPRWDNLYNMKRIAICWYEFAAEGLATALHVNGRTERDWERWGSFLVRHDEILMLAFEFRTGARYRDRGRRYAARLCDLAEKADRRLILFARGAKEYEVMLRDAFGQVITLSSDPFMKTVFRRKNIPHSLRGQAWQPTLTFLDQPLDELLQQNVDATLAGHSG